MIAWGLIPKFSCDPKDLICTKENNMGWRYLVLTLGSLTFIMFLCRFFLFHLYESPKFLLSRGRQEEAVATVHAIAYKNGAKTWLTNEILNEIGGHPEEVAPNEQKLSNMEIIKRQLSKFSGQRIAPLFATRKLGFTSMSPPFMMTMMTKKSITNAFLSSPPVVLLGHHWHGISPFQRLLAPVPRK